MAVCNTLPFAARKDTFCRLKGYVLQGKRYGFAVRWGLADLMGGGFFSLVSLVWGRGGGMRLNKLAGKWRTKAIFLLSLHLVWWRAVLVCAWKRGHMARGSE